MRYNIYGASDNTSLIDTAFLGTVASGHTPSWFVTVRLNQRETRFKIDGSHSNLRADPPQSAKAKTRTPWESSRRTITATS